LIGVSWTGCKSQTPITYGIHGSLELDDPKKRHRNNLNGPEEELVPEEHDGKKSLLCVHFVWCFHFVLILLVCFCVPDGKRQRRGAISDVPSAFKALDLSLFPPKPPHVVDMLERAVAKNPLLKSLERDERELL
jgi:hypothetical protein